VNRMDRPSGDQSTCHPSPAPTGPTTFEPSTSATNMRWSPVRFELKAIRVPSGDHDGYSPPSVLGSCLSPVPSGRIRVMIPLDPLGPAKAISAPSGDQAGASPRVKRCWPDPSACMSQISESPLRSERNAIVSPSGDHVASKSGQVEWARRVRPVPSAFMDQTSWRLSKTMRPERAVMGECTPLGKFSPGVGVASGPRGADPLEHPPTTRTAATDVVRMRLHFMPFLRLGWPSGSRRTGHRVGVIRGFLPHLSEPFRDRVQARHVGLHALVQERAQSRRKSAPEPLGLKGANVCSVEAGEGVGGQVVITACLYRR